MMAWAGVGLLLLGISFLSILSVGFFFGIASKANRTHLVCATPGRLFLLSALAFITPAFAAIGFHTMCLSTGPVPANSPPPWAAPSTIGRTELTAPVKSPGEAKARQPNDTRLDSDPSVISERLALLAKRLGMTQQVSKVEIDIYALHGPVLNAAQAVCQSLAQRGATARCRGWHDNEVGTSPGHPVIVFIGSGYPTQNNDLFRTLADFQIPATLATPRQVEPGPHIGRPSTHEVK